MSKSTRCSYCAEEHYSATDSELLEAHLQDCSRADLTVSSSDREVDRFAINPLSRALLIVLLLVTMPVMYQAIMPHIEGWSTTETLITTGPPPTPELTVPPPAVDVATIASVPDAALPPAPDAVIPPPPPAPPVVR